MIRAVINLCLAGCIVFISGGCQSSRCCYRNLSETKLPEWFTMPSGAEQSDTPVSMGIRLPKHLQNLSKKYELPNWVVYGVVRSLGSDEFLANGKIKTFQVSDADGEDSIVVDDVYYDVTHDKVDSVLREIVSRCASAENELERQNILGEYVVKRFGGIVLFSLNRAGSAGENLLLTTGESDDAMEVFNKTHPEQLPKIGWRETSTHYITTISGTFMYGNPVLAFRRTEEDAIMDLAKTLLLKLSHMRKSFADDIDKQADGIDEDVYCEEITLRMRGVRVQRRVVDVERGLCLVVVSVPRDGVALK